MTKSKHLGSVFFFKNWIAENKSKKYKQIKILQTKPAAPENIP